MASGQQQFTINGQAWSRAEAYVPILFGYAEARAKAKFAVDSDAYVNLRGSTTRLTAFRGADLQARHSGINIHRQAWHLAVALIPPQSSARGPILLFPHPVLAL